ncbi:MAG: hypothetical protein ACFFCX_00165 [Candidatus Sifarchaeia archaeon]
MKNEDIITEITLLLNKINETRDKIIIEHDRFLVALTNTLRLVDDGGSILIKMKGNVKDLKAYLIKTSTDLRQTSINSYENLRVIVERIRNLILAPQHRKS